MSIIAEVCQLVTDHLNSGGSGAYSIDFDAEFRYAPFEKLNDTELRVLVLPANQVMPVLTRNKSEYTVGVYVMVQKKLDDTEDYDLPEYVDPLVELMEEIELSIRNQTLTGDTYTAHWIGTTRDQLYNPQHISEGRMFTSVTTYNFKVFA